MRRDLHEVDLVSFVPGVLFGAIAVAYAIVRLAHGSVTERWVAPSVLIGLGLMLGAIAVKRASRHLHAAEAESPPA